MGERIIVSISVGDEATARTIAEALIDRRLAACVQSHPMTSRYRWEGKIVEDSEIMLTVKTRADLFAAIEACVVALNPYAVPEIVATPVTQGHAPYLDWVDAETASSSA